MNVTTACAISFALFYAEHSRAIERYLRSMLRHPEDAGDAAQEVWGAVWQRWGEVRALANPRAYVFTAAHHRATSALRHRRTVRVTTQPLDEVIAARIVSPDCLEFQVAERAIFAQIFSELPRDELRAFCLTLAGWPTATTPYLDKFRVRRARLRLAAAYDREARAPTPPNSSSLTPDQLRQLQRERGMCSEPDCNLPIEGFCATCDALGPFKAPKWCAIHLSLHCGMYGHTPFYPFAPEGRGMPA